MFNNSTFSNKQYMNLEEPALCQSTIWGRSRFLSEGVRRKGAAEPPVGGGLGHSPPEIFEIF